MKHFSAISSEFAKIAIGWQDLSEQTQREYLQQHPKSKRHLQPRQPKELSLSFARLDPSDLKRSLDEMAAKYFDKNEIDIDTHYSSYYMQDPNWKSYATIKIHSADKQKVRDFKADLAEFKRERKQQYV